MLRFERHRSPSLTRCGRYLFVFVVDSSLRRKKKGRKKNDRVLRPSDKERSAPVTGVSLSASQGLASVPRPNVCAPSGPHGTAPWARPSTWDSRLVVGQFRALGARPPHPCPRAKSCRVPSPSIGCPQTKPSTPSHARVVNATFLALANARGETRREIPGPICRAWFGTRHDSCVSCSSRACEPRPSMLCRLSRRHLWRSILPSRVAHAEPSDSMLHGNTCEVRDGDRPPSRFVERAREKCTGEKTALSVVRGGWCRLVRPVMAMAPQGVGTVTHRPAHSRGVSRPLPANRMDPSGIVDGVVHTPKVKTQKND